MPETLRLAGRALSTWTSRQYIFAAVFAIGFALLVGVATVLIPNSIFARDIDTVWWNYPVWILTSIGVGMLTATYLKPSASSEGDTAGDTENSEAPSERRATKMGIAGGVLTWFAVGCPVCNKIALLVLGYSGAITWFAPLQPVLAIVALVLTGVALVWRLKGQVVCAMPSSSKTT